MNYIKNSLEKSLSYKSFRKTVKEFIEIDKSTGNEQSETKLNFSKLNDKRMDRLDKTLSLTETTQKSLQELNKKFTLLVIAEGWCGDAAQILPILNKISEASENIEMKVVLRDENEELMNQFLTNGSQSIPKVILLNEANEVLNSWGPRPKPATNMVKEYKETHGSLDEEFKKNLQLWYNKDKGESTQEELLNLIKAS